MSEPSWETAVLALAPSSFRSDLGKGVDVSEHGIGPDMTTQARARRPLGVPLLQFLQARPLDEDDLTRGISRALAAVLVALGGFFTLIVRAEPALAAGPRALRISSDCLQPALEVRFTPSSNLNIKELAVAFGAWFTADAEDVVPLADRPPRGDLGRPYLLEWVFPASDEDNEAVVRQFLYLDAKSGAVVHTPLAQGLSPVAIGWYKAPPELYEILFRLRLPQTAAERCYSKSRKPVAATGAAGPIVIAAAAAFVVGAATAFIAGQGIGRRRARSGDSAQDT